MKPLVVGVCLVLGGCRCGAPTMQVVSDVRTSEATLAFGPVWVGDRATKTVQVLNTGAASLDVQVTVAPPFSASTALRLGGGESVALDVTFAPTSPTPTEQTLSLEWSGGRTLVTLVGEGRAVPDCTAATCQSVRFSFDAGVCVTEVLPDDAACSDACGSSGVCVAGVCRAAAGGACDDGNPCTVDACSATGGCVHVEAPLPVADPCQILHCEPDAGVVSEPAEDGLSCGEATCRTVSFCLNGACVSRPSANSDDDCRYTDVNQFGTCFVTRSAKLRCFGSSDGGDIGLALVPGATRMKRAEIDLDDALWPSNVFEDAGFTRFVEAQRTNFQLRAVTTTGELLTYSFNSRTRSVVLDAGVVGLCGVQGARMSDGGVEGAGAPAGAVDCVDSVVWDDWFLLGNGDLVDSAGRVMAGGVTRLPRYQGRHFMRGDDLFAITGDGGVSPVATWPEPVERVSSAGDSLWCGTSATGNAWCLGGLPGTRLSTNPNRPVELEGTWDQVDPLRRGGTTWLAGRQTSGDAGSSSLGLEHDWGQRRVDRASATCVLSGDELWCSEPDGGERLITRDAVSIEGRCAVTSSGQLRCVDQTRDDVLPGSGPHLWFPRDGGVAMVSYLTDAGTIDLRNPRVVTYPLAAPVSDVSNSSGSPGGCWVVLGQVWCSEMGSVPARKLVRFPARKVAGGVMAGCALIGNNRVECWGLTDSRFRVVQFDREVLDLEASIGGSTFVVCVHQRGGTVQCFGSNRAGELGVTPNRLQVFEQVTQ